MIKRILFAFVALVTATAPAFAHINPVEHAASFMAGFVHPLTGIDHILVMVAVGIWAASVGGKALWAVPLAFVGTMALGFAASMMGLPLPFVEPVILASVILIGVMVALALPLPTLGVAATVAFFAFFHGHAHGTELAGHGAMQFAGGFIVATALLHAVGIGIGLGIARIARGENGHLLTRAAGIVTAIGGMWLAVSG